MRALDIPRQPAARGQPSAFFYAALRDTTDQCVVWPFARNKKGYPQICRHNTDLGAHREICIEAHGPPPTPAHQAAHSCDNPSCINPRHLAWETQSENELDKRRSGTVIRGENHPFRKLTEKQVREIRSIGSTMSQALLGARFGISQTQIGSILRRESWNHI